MSDGDYVDLYDDLKDQVVSMKRETEKLRDEVAASLTFWNKMQGLARVEITGTFVPLSYACLYAYMADRLVREVRTDEENEASSPCGLFKKMREEREHHLTSCLDRTMNYYSKCKMTRSGLEICFMALIDASFLPAEVRGMIDAGMIDRVEKEIGEKNEDAFSPLERLALRAAVMYVSDRSKDAAKQ